MQNIYIRNLSATVTEELLKGLFTPFGEVVSVTIVKDRDTGAPRGFGFVEMADAAEAKSAITALNGTSVQGRRLSLNEARPKELDGVHNESTMRRHRKHRY
jgi:RNA recognition motif-containing protein